MIESAGQQTIAGFRMAVFAGCGVLGAAALVYAHLKSIPAAIALPVALAFLFEYPFYLLPGFPAARSRFMSAGKARAALALSIGGIVPWLIYAIPTGHFSLLSFALMSAIACVMCFWYVAFPAHPAADLIYLTLFAAIILLKIFTKIYPQPFPKLDISVLGHLMLIHVLAMSISGIRGDAGSGIPGADYRFIPSTGEWLAGFGWFAALLPVTGAAYWALGLVVLRAHPLNVLLGIGTFFGLLWTTAISEEFIFRGLLQSWIGTWTSSPAAAILTTALLFGSIHLTFHNSYPNWRFAIVAAILGLFCGLARSRTGGIQAGMVAHALIAAIWKIFFQ